MVEHFAYFLESFMFFFVSFSFLGRFRSFLRATILIIPIDKFKIITSAIVMINYVLIVISYYSVDRSAKARQRIVIGLVTISSFARL